LLEAVVHCYFHSKKSLDDSPNPNYKCWSRRFLCCFVITDHHTLFLACFSCYFQLIFIQNRGLLEQLLMIFRTFVMFSILSHVIMVFGKAKHLKTCEDFGKTMNVGPRGLRRHYKRRSYVPKSQDILYGSKHPKRRRNM